MTLTQTKKIKKHVNLKENCITKDIMSMDLKKQQQQRLLWL